MYSTFVELRWEGMNVGLSNGDLSPWVGQGVLLLNSALTVRQGSVQHKAGSHQKLWASFTKSLVAYINEASSLSAWLLWCTEAKKIADLISRPKHMNKSGAHPRATTGFFERKYFLCANEFLVEQERGQIKRRLRAVKGSFAKYIERCKAEGIEE